MTNTAYPINASAGSPAYSALQARQSMSALVSNGSSRVLGAVSGFCPGRLPTVLTVTTTTWTIGPFSAVIDPAFTTTQAPYLISADANNTNSNVAAANASNPRIDILYAQVNDTDIDSSGSRNFTVTYLAGTAAASPSAPATPARSFLLATISVPTSGGGSPTIAINNTFSAAAGGIVPVTNAAALPGTPYDGMAAYRQDVDSLVIYNGTSWLGAWTSYTPTFTNFTTGAATLLGKYMVWNKALFLRAGFIWGAGTAITGTLGISIPAGLTAVSDGFEQDIQVYELVSGVTVFAGLAGIPAGGSSFTVVRTPSSSSVTTLAALAATGGFTTGSTVIISGMIQLA